MRLPELCIRRPVFATLINLVILLIGIIAYQRLSVREYPDIDEPVVSVSTTFRGASAEIMELQVTQELEESLSGIEGNFIKSASRAESSRISITFRPSRDIDSAAADVQTAFRAPAGNCRMTWRSRSSPRSRQMRNPSSGWSFTSEVDSALQISDYVAGPDGLVGLSRPAVLPRLRGEPARLGHIRQGSGRSGGALPDV